MATRGTCRGHREQQGDGPRLRDGDDAACVALLHDVAHVGLLEARATGYGRRHTRVGQLQLRVVHGRLLGLDRAFELAHQSLLRLQLLSRQRVLGQQVAVAGQVEPGVFQLGLVARQRAFSLRKCRLQRARVDLRQQLAGLHRLTFLEVQALQHTTDLGAHRRGGGGRDRPHRADHRTSCRRTGITDTGCTRLAPPKRRPAPAPETGRQARWPQRLARRPRSPDLSTTRHRQP